MTLGRRISIRIAGGEGSCLNCSLGGFRRGVTVRSAGDGVRRGMLAGLLLVSAAETLQMRQIVVFAGRFGAAEWADGGNGSQRQDEGDKR